MQWVKPNFVVQIRFVEWTAEGRLRHAAFLGLRSDKIAREVRREAHEVTS
jgi:ATP-dependent DNA ligase